MYVVEIMHTYTLLYKGKRERISIIEEEGTP